MKFLHYCQENFKKKRLYASKFLKKAHKILLKGILFADYAVI